MQQFPWKTLEKKTKNLANREMFACMDTGVVLSILYSNELSNYIHITKNK